MAAFLTTDESDILDWVVNYSEQSPIDRPPDDKVVQELARLAETFGFDGPIAFKEAMRDRPIHTLIKVIQTLNANA